MNEQVVILTVDGETVIRDAFGSPMSLRDLRQGMVVDAEFSAIMTRSMPPQSRAFRITVIDSIEESSVTEGRVLDIDLNNRFLYTGNPNDIYSQIRFVITDSTVIRDRRGRQIRLRDLRVGDFVRVVHATFMTMSIPPQTTAYEVEVL
jgi:predicted RNA-binding protein